MEIKMNIPVQTDSRRTDFSAEHDTQTELERLAKMPIPRRAYTQHTRWQQTVDQDLTKNYQGESSWYTFL